MLVLGSVGSIETNKSHKQVYNEHFLPARFETFFGYMVSNHKWQPLFTRISVDMIWYGVCLKANIESFF